MNKLLRSNGETARAVVCLLLLLPLLCVGCGFRKPWRSYEQQPFDSGRWKAGDALTRGTMIVDLHRNRTVNGKSHEEVQELLGEPDKKRSGAGGRSAEVWLYQIETVGEKPRQYFPVSFDKQGAAWSGEARGGTLSLLVDE